ncbi:hypothetical protein ROZALSC1DRAFT_22210, partial [Rozella allomycis CSF55]
MFHFTGNFKSKREISLGGVKPKYNRFETLNNALEGRFQRELERNRQRSAVIIQEKRGMAETLFREIQCCDVNLSILRFNYCRGVLKDDKEAIGIVFGLCQAALNGLFNFVKFVLNLTCTDSKSNTNNKELSDVGVSFIVQMSKRFPNVKARMSNDVDCFKNLCKIFKLTEHLETKEFFGQLLNDFVRSNQNEKFHEIYTNEILCEKEIFEAESLKQIQDYIFIPKISMISEKDNKILLLNLLKLKDKVFATLKEKGNYLVSILCCIKSIKSQNQIEEENVDFDDAIDLNETESKILLDCASSLIFAETIFDCFYEKEFTECACELLMELKSLNQLLFSTLTRKLSLFKSISSSLKEYLTKNSNTSSALILLCEIQSSQLYVMSDNELLKDEEKIKDLIFISDNLKNIAVDYFLQKIYEFEEFNKSSQFTPLFKLLDQINDKDQRLNFCPEFHWRSDKIRLSSFPLLKTIDFNPNYYPSDDIECQKKWLTKMLQSIPYCFDFHERIKLFYSLVEEDAYSAADVNEYGVFMGPRINIQRGNEFESGFQQMNSLGHKWKQKIRISFLDEFQQVEEGVDGGGLYKEFLNNLLKIALSPNYGLFKFITIDDYLTLFSFLGRVIGKALCDRILIDVPFVRFFIAKWIGKHISFDDLALLDQDLYKNLLFLRDYKGNVEDLNLTFSIADD